MRLPFFALLAIGVLSAPAFADPPIVPGSMDVRWDEGAPDCKASHQPPIQAHEYNSQTYILRENLCATFEAPFIYLLVGSDRALLIDTGDVADSGQMPLAQRVMDLLPGNESAKLPLLVVHTHRHLDHRAGDAQFARSPNVQLVGFDLDSVKRFYKFANWPEGIAHIDLGHRIVDVLPTPGHNETHLVFYDRNTALLFSGDFMMPARLLIDDTSAELASARRVAAFVKDRPVSYVLGGHIEMNKAGELFPWESQYHPQEIDLPMTKADLLALPAAVESFNGFYTQSGKFTLIDTMHNLIAAAVVAIAVLVAAVMAVVAFFRRRRRRLAKV